MKISGSLKSVLQNFIYLLSAIAVIRGEAKVQKCASKKYNEDSIVCVCSSKYCDDVGRITVPSPGSCLHFESNRAGLRLESQPCKISKRKGIKNPLISEVTVNPTQKYQEILGFGGAITDSVGINLASLSSQTQKTLLSQYFGPESIGYTFIRLPMGGTDFSTRVYTYDDVANDTTLSHFQLAEEDHRYKIPLVKKAMELSTMPIKLITTMWQAPKWMEESRFPVDFLGLSKLKQSCYQLLADYMIRYLDSYKREGLEFWALSPQNEPYSNFFFFWVPNALSWTPKEQAYFLKDNLIPTLRSKGYDNLKLFLLEDARFWINFQLRELEKYPEVLERAAGVSVHWYFDKIYPASVFSDVKRRFQNWTFISTEASILRMPGRSAVRLGFWGNAERYISDIMEDLNNEVAAWVDWNIALDLNGGPTYISNYLDSPIIVNASADEFYKQPMFYAMAHFSKFVPPGSFRINLRVDGQPRINAIAFGTPDKNVTIVLTNRNNQPVKTLLRLENIGEIDVTLSPRSFSTVICRSNT